MVAAVVPSRNRWLSRAFSGGLVLVGLAIPACQSGGNTSAVASDQAPVATPVEHQLLKGIPVPAGFRIIPEHSRARNLGETRVAQCEFEGSLAAGDVARFYEHYMPTARFTLGPKLFNSGEYAIRFESDTEECNVWIKPKAQKTILIIDIGPRATGSAAERNLSSPPSADKRSGAAIP